MTTFGLTDTDVSDEPSAFIFRDNDEFSGEVDECRNFLPQRVNFYESWSEYDFTMHIGAVVSGSFNCTSVTLLFHVVPRHSLSVLPTVGLTSLSAVDTVSPFPPRDNRHICNCRDSASELQKDDIRWPTDYRDVMTRTVGSLTRKSCTTRTCCLPEARIFVVILLFCVRHPRLSALHLTQARCTLRFNVVNVIQASGEKTLRHV
jgi:hypothetical protein